MMVDIKVSKRDMMQRALDLAARRRGFCAPNPAVGAVVVNADNIVGEGYHQACGQPHAEVGALQQAGEAALGACLYVTLEPCCHYGRTPPCTELIIQSGIKQVYYGFADPNPEVAGQGEAALKAAGVDCQHLPLKTVDDFYQSYHYWWQYKKPWVTVKLAMSLDGKIAGVNGKTVAITGDACQQLTHQWRRQSDAILTTARTVIADDPRLTVRLDNETIKKNIYILDRNLQLPFSIRLIDSSQRLTLLHQPQVPTDKVHAWQQLGVRCQSIAVSHQQLDWQAVLARLGADGVHDLWVEAGGQCCQSLLQQQLIHRLLLYIAPKTLGEQAVPSFTQTFSLVPPATQFNWQQYGDDMVLSMEYLPVSLTC